MSDEQTRIPTEGSADVEPDSRVTAAEEIAALIEADATAEQLATHIETQEGPDAADTLEQLDPEDSAELLRAMERKAAAEALANMELPLAVTVLLHDIDVAEAAAIIQAMADDDAADILQALPDDRTRDVLAAMHPRRAAAYGKLALYDPETAGGLMTTDIMVVRERMRIGQAIDAIKRNKIREDQYEVYCVDDDRRLVGVIGLHTLLTVDDDQPIADWIERDIDVLDTGLDQEDVARLFERYDYITLPVVDQERRVLGMVTIDDVLDIISEEHTEDAYKQVGAGVGEAVYSPVSTKLKGRFPWLVVNLVTAQIGAAGILIFNDMIALIPVAGAIYPVIANQSGNAGQQSLAVTLRGLVLGEIRPERVFPLIFREFLFSILAGVGIGVIFTLAIAILAASGVGVGDGLTWKLGLVAGIAMTGALAVSCVVGTLIPLLMDRFKLDPATASSIFLTMITDALSYATFLGLAYLMKGWLTAGLA